MCSDMKKVILKQLHILTKLLNKFNDDDDDADDDDYDNDDEDDDDDDDDNSFGISATFSEN